MRLSSNFMGVCSIVKANKEIFSTKVTRKILYKDNPNFFKSVS